LNIGEELQAAFGHSTKLGSMLSALFESDKPDADVAEGDKTTQRGNAPGTDGEAPHEAVNRVDETADATADTAEATAEATADVPADAAQSAEEAALVARAQAEPTAFGELYERYVDRIYAYIYHRVGNTQDAEDLTARTFYRALAKLHTYEDRGFPFSAWLFRIAHNLVANWHRDHSLRHFLSLDRIWSHSQDTETPEHVVERAERHSALWAAINRLPDDRRNLLLYKFGSRLSNVEIGELMDKSESAVKSLYFRTLAALRTDLEARDW